MTPPQVSYPLWFLAPLLLVAVVALTPRSLELPGEWSRVITSSLRAFLAQGVKATKRRERLSPMLLIWIVLAAALATISVGHVDTPSLRNLHARVVVVDLGLGDDSEKPVSAARHFLENASDAPTALVAVTSKAFIVVPFTTDHQHIDRYMEVLEPDVMPVAGRTPMLGIDRANRLLLDNEIIEGQIIVFTGGQPPSANFKVGKKPTDSKHIWFVMNESSQTSWENYAGQWNAKVVDQLENGAIHQDLEKRRQRAVTSTASIRQRRELTPWFILATLVLWLLIYFRKEES